MKLGWFETTNPVPELRNPHAFLIIPSWLNAGESASLALSALEESTDAQPLAVLTSPGEFFDFTRYRPTTSMSEGTAKIEVPTVIVTSSRGLASDFIFLRVPEPHMRSEQYIESVMELFKYFKVRRYIFLGSVYEMLPHTRPPIVTGLASSQWLQSTIEIAKVLPTQYEGPTSILSLIANEAEKIGVETLNLVVHLPGYFQLTNHHRGETRLLEVLETLYQITIPKDAIDQAKQESEQIAETAESFLKANPQMRFMLTQLENNYDARVNNKQHSRLSPEIEKYLRDLSQRFDSGQNPPS